MPRWGMLEWWTMEAPLGLRGPVRALACKACFAQFYSSSLLRNLDELTKTRLCR